MALLHNPNLSYSSDSFNPDEQIACHEKIAQMTRDMAMITFETWLEKNNTANKILKRNGRRDHARYIFVDAFAATLIDVARGYIAKALGNPCTPEEQKAPYVIALMQDAEIPNAATRVAKAQERYKFIAAQHPLFQGDYENV